MKKIIVLFIMMVIFSGCSTTKPAIMQKQFDEKRIVHYSELKNFGDDVVFPSGYVFYINSGEIIPLKLKFDNELLGIRQNEIELVAKQKLYFVFDNSRNSGKPQTDWEFYISRDGLNWASVKDIESLRTMLGAEKGSLSIGMGMEKQKGLWAELAVKTQKK